jgi:hypothetical protein
MNEVSTICVSRWINALSMLVPETHPLTRMVLNSIAQGSLMAQGLDLQDS